MPKITFDATINIPTVLSILTAIVSVVVFVMSMKGDIKALKAQISINTQEIGELRRAQLQIATASQEHDTEIKTNAARVKQVTKTLKSVGVDIPPEVK